MLSVSQRVESVSQPYGGYVPQNLFVEKIYDDNVEVIEIDAAFAAIQGMVVDYLTRLTLSNNKYLTFDISIRGAQRIDRSFGNNDEYNKIMSLLEKVNGIDDVSIYNACKIVGYDSALRRGVNTYKNIDSIIPSPELISNIHILVSRSLEFLKDVGQIIETQVMFPGGYTKLVSSGDGDYMTQNSLIDLKVSKKLFSPKWSLQLLMYYLLGCNSKDVRFKNLKELCIFNPYLNKSMTVQLVDISDEVKYTVSHDVLGYKMAFDISNFPKESKTVQAYYSTWARTEGTDYVLMNSIISQNLPKSFDITSFPDGIHDIGLDDYYAYLCSIDDYYQTRLRPGFRNIDYVILIKRNGYVMFLSVSPKGTLGVLNGAALNKTAFSATYFYENIERYAEAITARFSNYWNAQNVISKQIKSIRPNEEFLRKEHYSKYVSDCELRGIKKASFEDWYQATGKNIRLSGKIHGCIVDIDYHNHIYINPYDGSIIPYSASTMYDKNVYKNTLSLIAANMPEMLESFMDITNNKELSLALSNVSMHELINYDDPVSDETVKVYEYDMYGISNKIKPLYNIYDKKLIQVWYEKVLKDNIALLEDKYLNQTPRPSKPAHHVNNKNKKYIGVSIEQQGGITAKLVEYRNYYDIDVLFEDGLKVCNAKMEKWVKGKMIHPNVKKQFDAKKEIDRQAKAKQKYIGMTRKMKCGLMATIIDYVDSKNVTIQFEDGLIKHNVRPDKFKDGGVSHEA